MNVAEHEIPAILRKYKKVCVIGLSRDPQKAAQRVPLFAKSKGWDIVGVHPSEKNIAGIPCFQNLSDVPKPYRKFIDVFRPSSEIPNVVQQVISLGDCEVLFLQKEITHPAAEKLAEETGIRVISDHCLLVEIKKLET